MLFTFFVFSPSFIKVKTKNGTVLCVTRTYSKFIIFNLKTFPYLRVGCLIFGTLEGKIGNVGIRLLFSTFWGSCSYPGSYIFFLLLLKFLGRENSHRLLSAVCFENIPNITTISSLYSNSSFWFQPLWAEVRQSVDAIFYQPRSGMVKGRCGLLLLFSKKTFVELFLFRLLVWFLVSY